MDNSLDWLENWLTSVGISIHSHYSDIGPTRTLSWPVTVGLRRVRLCPKKSFERIDSIKLAFLKRILNRVRCYTFD